MAEVTVTEVKLTKIVLALTDREKNILAAMVQNAFDEDETEEAAKLRLSIFNALKPPQVMRSGLDLQ